MTAIVLRDEIEQYFQVGFNGYVAKPFDGGTLYREMGRFLSVVGGEPLATVPPNSECFEGNLSVKSSEPMLEVTSEPSDESKKKKKLAFSHLCMNYRDELPQILQRIESQYFLGDWEALRKEVHNIKGTAGSFGFSDITTAATDVDKLFKAKAIDAIEAPFQRLCDKIRTPRSSFLDE